MAERVRADVERRYPDHVTASPVSMKKPPVFFAVVLIIAGCGGNVGASPTASPAPALPAPVMIQIENSDQGRPQSGLATANLVYEYVAEGGIGRFSLVFFGPPSAAQQVGPVRSARTVTVKLAEIYKALLMYSGASTYLTSLLNSASFPSFDEDTAQGSLFRVGFRPAPHNLYTDGRGMASLSSRAALPPVAYQLWTRTSAVPAGGKPVTSFTTRVSASEQPEFTWQPMSGGFTRTEDTGLVKDPNTGAPLVIPAVIVQQVAVTTDPNVVDVNGSLGVDHAVTGSGPAQVFTEGREYMTTWTQPSSGPPQFGLAGGSLLPIAPGEVWIVLVPTGQPALVK